MGTKRTNKKQNPNPVTALVNANIYTTSNRNAESECVKGVSCSTRRRATDSIDNIAHN